MYAIGLMSGTSLDGVDAALVKIEEGMIEPLLFHTHTIPETLKERIKISMDPKKSNSPLICQLNFELGQIFAEASLEVVKRSNISLLEIDFIASHGQTIYHMPNDKIPSTLQIGEPAVIAGKTGCKVISNFRTMDMVFGGQGAPLVPFFDYHYFKSDEITSVLLNLGGIANITVVPKGGALDGCFAFDTGPANMIIDELVNHFYGESYDSDGFYASKGTVNENVLKNLMEHPYFKIQPPKSTGREMFGKGFVNDLLERYKELPADDLIATATMFTAKTIAMNIEAFVSSLYPVDQVIVSGGGARNRTLMASLCDLLDCNVKSIDAFGISSEEKEAVAFAFLGYMTLNKRPSNVPSATGASKSVVLGSITYPPF